MKKILILCTTMFVIFGIGINVSAYTEIAYGDYLYYRINDDKTGVTITDCRTAATEIVIPSEIDGLPVTSIGSYAFHNCSRLTSVTIPDRDCDTIGLNQ